MPDSERLFTADQQAAAKHLIDVHGPLRAELGRLRDLIEQVAQGTVDIGTARSFINKMTIRQNDWTRGGVLRVLLPRRHRPSHSRGPQPLPAPQAARPQARARRGPP